MHGLASIVRDPIALTNIDSDNTTRTKPNWSSQNADTLEVLTTSFRNLCRSEKKTRDGTHEKPCGMLPEATKTHYEGELEDAAGLTKNKETARHMLRQSTRKHGTRCRRDTKKRHEDTNQEHDTRTRRDTNVQDDAKQHKTRLEGRQKGQARHMPRGRNMRMRLIDTKKRHEVMRTYDEEGRITSSKYHNCKDRSNEKNDNGRRNRLVDMTCRQCKRLTASLTTTFDKTASGSLEPLLATEVCDVYEGHRKVRLGAEGKGSRSAIQERHI